MSFRTAALQGHTQLEAIRDAWRGLFRRASSDCPFSSESWFRHGLKHFHRGDEPVVFVAYEGDLLVGLVAFAHHGGFLPTLTTVAPVVTSTIDVLVDRTCDSVQVTNALLGEIERFPAVAVLWHNVPEASTLGRALRRDGATRVVEGNDWLLSAPQTWETYVGSARKKMRSTLRKIAQGKAGQRRMLAQNKEDVRKITQTTGELCAARWNTRGSLCGWNLHPDFYLDVASDLFDEGIFAGSLLLGDEGNVMAGEFGLKSGGHLHIVYSGFDDAMSRDSASHLLRHESLHALMSETSGAYRFGAGEEPYKRESGAQAVRLISFCQLQSPRGWLVFAQLKVTTSALTLGERGAEWLWWKERGDEPSPARHRVQRALAMLVERVVHGTRK